MTVNVTPTVMAAQSLRGPLAFAGVCVDAWAEGARMYWSFWGPFAEPAIGVVEIVAGMQRRSIASLAGAFDSLNSVP